jgi:hypothetical protein
VCNGSDIHLTGIVAMLLASKYGDSNPLRLSEVVEQIGHREFRLQDIAEREREVAQTLGFNLGFPTVYDFLESNLAAGASLYTSDVGEVYVQALGRMRQHCIYFAMMAYHDYPMLIFS